MTQPLLHNARRNRGVLALHDEYPATKVVQRCPELARPLHSMTSVTIISYMNLEHARHVAGLSVDDSDDIDRLKMLVYALCDAYECLAVYEQINPAVAPRFER